MHYGQTTLDGKSPGENSAAILLWIFGAMDILTCRMRPRFLFVNQAFVRAIVGHYLHCV